MAGVFEEVFLKSRPDRVYLAVVEECFQLILEGDEDSSGAGSYVMCKHKSELSTRAFSSHRGINCLLRE